MRQIRPLTPTAKFSPGYGYVAAVAFIVLGGLFWLVGGSWEGPVRQASDRCDFLAIAQAYVAVHAPDHDPEGLTPRRFDRFSSVTIWGSRGRPGGSPHTVIDRESCRVVDFYRTQ